MKLIKNSLSLSPSTLHPINLPLSPSTLYPITLPSADTLPLPIRSFMTSPFSSFPPTPLTSTAGASPPPLPISLLPPPPSPVLLVLPLRIHRLDGRNHLGLVKAKVLRARDGGLGGRGQRLAVAAAGLDLVVDAAQDLGGG